MSPTNFVTMRLTPRAAGLLRQAVRYSHELDVTPCKQLAKADLGYALSLHNQNGGGGLDLSNDADMRNTVGSVIWTAANAGPVEMRSSFRTLYSVFEKFGSVLGGDDAKKMTERLGTATSSWRRRGSRQSELPSLYEDIYGPFARMIREKVGVMMRGGVDQWAEALIENIDVIDAFGRHDELGSKCEDVFLSLYTVLGMQSLYRSLIIICGDLCGFDYEDIAQALKVEGRDSAADMVTYDYSLSGLCMMSEYSEDVILNLGRAADYVRRKDSVAVNYLLGMAGKFDLYPVAERSRLFLLWHALDNVDDLTEELDMLWHDTAERISDLDDQLLAKVEKKESTPSVFGSE